jgi:hypothetical protein
MAPTYGARLFAVIHLYLHSWFRYAPSDNPNQTEEFMRELAAHLPTDVHSKASRLSCKRVDWCGRKSNYIYGMSKGDLNICFCGLGSYHVNCTEYSTVDLQESEYVDRQNEVDCSSQNGLTTSEQDLHITRAKHTEESSPCGPPGVRRASRLCRFIYGLRILRFFNQNIFSVKTPFDT